MSQNNLLEVRHYAEVFLMKMIYLGKGIDYERVCNNVSHRLTEIVGQSSLGKNLSYMVVGGLLLQEHYH